MRRKKLVKGLALLLTVTTIASLNLNALPVYGETETTVAQEGKQEDLSKEETASGGEPDVNDDQKTGMATTEESSEALETEEEETTSEGVGSKKEITDKTEPEESAEVPETENDRNNLSEKEPENMEEDPGSVPSAVLEDAQPKNAAGTESTGETTKESTEAATKESTEATTETTTEEKSVPVENPRWGDQQGYITWDGLPEDQQAAIKGIFVQLYKDGEFVENWNIHGYMIQYNMNSRLSTHGPGRYSFRAVWKLAENMETNEVPEDKWSAESDGFEYTVKGQKAVLPTDIKWNEDGSIYWKPVNEENMPGYTGAVVYSYDFYEDGEKIDTWHASGLEGHTYTYFRQYSHIQSMKVGHTYTFTLRTGGDGVNYENSDPTEMSAPFVMKASQATAGGKLESLAATCSGTNAEAIVQGVEITDEEKQAMKRLVQEDKEAADNFFELERTYQNATGKSFEVRTESSAVDSAKVSVAGGALNGATQIRFVPAQKQDTSLPSYSQRVTVDISLDTNTLKFPVLISMEAPRGMDPEKVRIYHYHGDERKETINPAVVTESGIKKLQFAVSEFSIFTFVELSGSTSTGGNAWSGSSVSSGRSSSDDGGSPVINLKVPDNAPVLTGQWIKDEKGWWFKKTDRSYPKNQWAKINNVTYWFNEAGYMAEGWIYLDHKWYYLKPESGDLAKGWILDKGKWYYLNKRGVMATGWLLLTDKWYYLGKDGAMLTNTTTPDNYVVDENGVWVK